MLSINWWQNVTQNGSPRVLSKLTVSRALVGHGRVYIGMRKPFRRQAFREVHNGTSRAKAHENERS